MDERPLDSDHRPPLTLPDLSPEARRKRARDRLKDAYDEHVGPEGRFWNSRPFRVIARVWTGAYHDGFIHAGNLAYMAILALFPFFITVGAAFSLIGEQAQREASVHAFLAAMPPVVATALEPVAMDVIVARSGWLLWVGGLVGLWTVGSLIETIRDILRRAYGTQATRAFASATTTGPFSTNQTGFDGIKGSLKPESSDTYELGARYNDSTFNGVIVSVLGETQKLTKLPRVHLLTSCVLLVRLLEELRHIDR